MRGGLKLAVAIGMVLLGRKILGQGMGESAMDPRSLSLAVVAPAKGLKSVWPAVGLAWSNSVSPGVVGYEVGEGLAAGIYTNLVWTTNGAVTVSNLVRGPRYYFGVAAVNEWGLTSVWSAPVSFDGYGVERWFYVSEGGTNIYTQLCAGGPEWFRLTGTNLQGSGDFMGWTNMMNCGGATMGFSNEEVVRP